MVEEDKYQQAKLQTTKSSCVQDAVDRPAKQEIADIRNYVAVLATPPNDAHQSQRLLPCLRILLSRAMIKVRDRSSVFPVP